MVAKVKKNAQRKFRRGFRRRQKSAFELGQQADQKIEKLLIRRLERLISVRRFIVLWLALILLLFATVIYQLRALSPYYQSWQPVAGGIFNEGMVGEFTNANPIYATGVADTAVSHLIFSGLLKYDDKNNLVGDLAQSWQLSSDYKTYIVHLKNGVLWHDGQPVTADDVVFTYQTIQNPATQSFLNPSWQGVIVSKLDPYTVSFKLPSPLTAFPYSLTTGILPAHLLKTINPAELRSAPFNTNPVGTGPFVWKHVEVTGLASDTRQQRISLSINPNYNDERPKLDGYIITTFSDDQQMLAAYKHKDVNAISGLDNLPDDIKNNPANVVHVTPFDSAVTAFFNNSNGSLGDTNVRKALISAVDTSKLVTMLDYPVNLVDEPLLKNQFGYNPHLAQFGFSTKTAQQLLDKAGFRVGAHGLRYKNGHPLQLTLRTEETSNYTKVAQFLQSEWRAIGVNVNVYYYSNNDLEASVIANHDYDILLYGISIGVDPDVFAFWDSSQASVSSSGHLNLSEYKSTLADQALEAGRTRVDPKIRLIKYQNFLQVWRGDAPALMLYQPNFILVSHGPIYYYERQADITSADHYDNVADWMIRQQRKSH